MAVSKNDWQLGCKEIKQGGARLLESGQLSDCTFLVGTEPNQASMAGHKFVCAMASPVFEAMFYGTMAEKNHVVSIPDIEPDTFKNFLIYMYTDTIQMRSFDNACNLYYAANKYLMSHLKEQCIKYIKSNLHPKNVCQAYEFAKFNEEQALMTATIQIIMEKTKEVIQDRSFYEVELDTIIMVFSLDKLDIDSELDLFNAAKNYVEAQKATRDARKLFSLMQKAPCKTSKSMESSILPEAINEKNSPVMKKKKTSLKKIPMESQDTISTDTSASPSEDEVVCDQDREMMRSVIGKIRFLSLTPQQFAQGPARSAFLTKSEAYAIFMNMLTTWTDVPMPRGFSTSKASR